MTELRSALVDWLRTEFIAEQQTGFAVLSRVPDTRVIRFLDHFSSLNCTDQAALREILIEWSSYNLLGPPPNPVYERFTNALAVALSGLGTGLRYMGVKLLAGISNDPSHGGLSGFFKKQGVTGLALEHPQELLRTAGDIIPVSPPMLRRLVKDAFSRLFATQITDIGSETWRYEGVLNDCLLRVHIRYSGRMGRPQLDYRAEIIGMGREIVSPGLCFESALGVGFGRWDYITKQNAEHSVHLLTELVAWLGRLPERLPSGCCQVPAR